MYNLQPFVVLSSSVVFSFIPLSLLHSGEKLETEDTPAEQWAERERKKERERARKRKRERERERERER